MSELAKIRNARTLPQLANLLGLNGKILSYTLYWVAPERKYTSFTIPKKSGGRRHITAPSSRLKLVQRRLAGLLSQIQVDLEAKRTSSQCILSHGFKKNYSIITNADCHRNKRYVFNADLKDFFPSINFGRVSGFFIKDQNFALDPKIATIIAQIACHDNQLPQGSPCSPVISNLVAHILDIQLNKLAKAGRCTYTRYVDDLTFSTNEKQFPASIARLVRGSGDKWVAGDGLVERVYRAGFRLNELKTRMQYCNSRQDATGLVVNKKINVRHEYYKQVRAMCHQLFVNGFCYSKVESRYIAVPDTKLEGMMNFIYQIRRIKTADFTKEQRGFSNLYKQFLDYKSFYGIVAPRIICEGKTDSIYLRSAIKSLRSKFPTLINTTGEHRLLVNFFNFTTASATFQGLSGGGSQLNTLLGTYGSRISSFKGGVNSPVLIVVDNDSGSDKIFKHLSNVLRRPVDGTEPYYFVYENLYVVPIPKNGVTAAIEDLFDPVLLRRKIEGKEFDRTGKKTDGKKWYGKFEFATKIVRAEQSTIDFTGFEPLLKAFTEAIDDYSVRCVAKAKVAAARAA